MILDAKKINEFLKNLNIECLNEMQEEMLKQYKNDNDLLLLSPTGSGKTLGFILPILSGVDTSNNSPQVLIVTPTRELAIQIQKVFKSLQTGIKSICCYGGNNIKKEINELSQNPLIVIGTPGRLLDHFRNGNIPTDTFSQLIFDEYDKSLEMGFSDEISSLTSQLKNIKKKILTSATKAEAIPDYISLKKPITISYLNESNIGGGLSLYQVNSPLNDKLDTLFHLLCQIGKGPKIIFCNYKDSINRISEFLNRKGIYTCSFHGDLDQALREKSITRFTNGSTEVLIATDLAARGLDIPFVGHIIHYHLPHNEEAFIHRNGRTARQNNTGNSYIILGPDEFLPEYITEEPYHYKLDDNINQPSIPEWETLYIGKGKKDKLSKGDIAGFLIKKGELNKEQIGLIDVKDLHSFVSIKRDIIHSLIKKVSSEKIKNMKTKFLIAKI